MGRRWLNDDLRWKGNETLTIGIESRRSRGKEVNEKLFFPVEEER